MYYFFFKIFVSRVNFAKFQIKVTKPAWKNCIILENHLTRFMDGIKFKFDIIILEILPYYLLNTTIIAIYCLFFVIIPRRLLDEPLTHYH